VSHTVALLTFAIAGAVLTVTPGLDTMLVLRTALLGGRRPAASAAFGICCGLLLWGLLVAVGLGALLTASRLAYAVLRWAGAAYLLWLGLALLLHPRRDGLLTNSQEQAATRPRRWLLQGLLTNLLNPKVGVFYVSFLPQFVPPGVAVAPFVALLAAIHVVEGALWFALLIVATQPITRWIRRPTVATLLSRLTGAVFVSFGLRLVVERQ
jgi:threonine/homoserine/homoserine lactone efflux protein